ncbi:hypothetical protein FF38_01489 [Lucilia cuprina]|uniref:Leucine-rich repeat-containing protein 56 n=1 Tax=Lucilia cuprina TaxID=7375 RepID=A0A0L0CKG7_LUCCU|nr:Leucine-rich repeat-containing protein 56 [Lucilia cuprina]KNC32760.1 hypothetical protein FF38_01489 [Lucilia cuprina]
MPLLEAPQDLSESSPEVSINQDVPAVQRQEQIAVLPVAAAQVRQPLAEPQHIQVSAEVLQLNNRNRERNFRVLGSFDRDIIEAEEENHFPAYVHLLPVVLPPQAPEPTLDELLRRVTSRSDLHNVETVRLRVISYTLSLSHLAMFLPRLQHLDLSGSVLCSLRDLGYGLVHLSHLNVSNCGLNSFDGTSGFPALRVLIADDNMIQRINTLTDLMLLQHLSVRNNRISELSMLTFLGLCGNLMELHLQGNPVRHQPFYRETLQRSIPSLQVLDGVMLQHDAVNEDITTNNMPSLESDDVSSLSSASSSIKLDLPDRDQRPATAPTINCDNHNNASGQQRPNSVSVASRSNSLSSGSPVIGSVVALARQRLHRKRHMANAWASSDSSTYSTASSNSSTRPPSSVSSNGSYDCISTTQANGK